MSRWWTLGLLLAASCEEDQTARDYNTGANGTNPTSPTGPTQTDDTWDCDELCDAVETDNDVLCLIDALQTDGFNLILYPRCPSWLNYENTDAEECKICAVDLELTDADCQRYRSQCGM